MRAVVCSRLGGPECLETREIDPPVPGDDEVLVRVRAAGVNFADTLQIAGTYQNRLAPPFVPGMEVAGEILEIGPAVTRPLRVGQRVMAFMRGGGAFAEQAVVNGDWLVPVPDGMDDVIAAGFPTVYGTSGFALRERGALQPGETLLVLGAAGGVGLTAVELGRCMGATVIAAAGGPEKCAVALEHGAHHTIDYLTESIRDRVRALTDGAGADVVYDPVGGDAFDQALRAVAWRARMLVIGFASGTNPAGAGQHRAGEEHLGGRGRLRLGDRARPGPWRVLRLGGGGPVRPGPDQAAGWQDPPAGTGGGGSRGAALALGCRQGGAHDLNGILIP